MVTTESVSEGIGNLYDAWLTSTELYNELLPQDDCLFYKSMVEANPGVIVELGIGYGRVAVHTRPKYGVDLSAVSLSRCKELMQEHTPVLLEADFLAYKLPELATLTYIVQNTINHVPLPQRRALFQTVWKNTVPGGLFIFDCFVPKLDRMFMRSHMLYLAARSDSHAFYFSQELVSRKTQQFSIQCVMETLDEHGVVLKRQVMPKMDFCYMHPEQFVSVAADTNWLVKACWGNFAKGELTPDSYQQIWVLQKPMAG